LKFSHLNVPSHWRHEWSKYPEGYTILEALLNWVQQVDNMADNINDWNNYLDHFTKTVDLITLWGVNDHSITPTFQDDQLIKVVEKEGDKTLVTSDFKYNGDGSIKSIIHGFGDKHLIFNITYAADGTVSGIKKEVV
jgi:hypothetical protein